MYRDEGRRVFGVFTFGKIFLDGSPLFVQQNLSSVEQFEKVAKLIKGSFLSKI